MQSGIGLVHGRERGIKFGLCLIKIRFRQALCGVKRLRAFVVVLCLDVLRRYLTELGFRLVNLVFQVLLTNLRKYSAAGDIVSRAYVTATAVCPGDLLNVCYITRRLEGETSLSKGHDGSRVAQTFWRSV